MGMHVNSLPMASVITQPHHLKSIRTKRLGFFGIICLASCTAPRVASLTASVLVRGTPTLGAAVGTGCCAHWGSSGPWICLGTALWAFENTGFNEVKLATCFHGQPPCSLIRLNQNFYSLSTSKGN